jgi:uncharacterized protein (TIGR02217 family)
MSSQVFPTLAGQGWSIKRTPNWKTQVMTSASGKETRVGFWSSPVYEWEVVFNLLRQGTVNGTAYTEMQQLMGLYNILNGSYDTFLYQDQDDKAVTGQAIGTGDGTTTVFQLARAFGGFVEPILAPNVVSAVYKNGVLQGSGYTVSSWGSALPGKVTFSVAPAAGVVITVDFSYYWPCRFVDDALQFDKFLQGYYQTAAFKFRSVKN